MQLGTDVILMQASFSLFLPSSALDSFLSELWLNFFWPFRVQKQLMSLVQMESLQKAVAMLQTGAAIDVAILADAVDHLEV